jgi:NAD(P)H-nitrite reductase large subunit
MSGVEKEYVWGTGMNAVDFFGFPVISAGLFNPQDDDDIALTRLEPDENTYRKFIIRDGRIVGMILLNEVDRAGVVLGLMRQKIDVTAFKDDLLRGDFGSVHIPRGIRQKIDEEMNVAAV